MKNWLELYLYSTPASQSRFGDSAPWLNGYILLKENESQLCYTEGNGANPNLQMSFTDHELGW